MSFNSSGKLFIISAPSGAGKTTLVKHVVDELGHEYPLKRVITYTTKLPRQNEVNGVDYHFLSQEEFLQKIDEQFFIEHSTAYGAYYGFPRSVLTQIEKGESFIVILDRAGAASLKAHKEDSVLIWIKPPCEESLRSRLESRGQDDEGTIASRMLLARQELEEECNNGFFEHIIINECFESAAQELTIFVKNKIMQK